ncbi:hypothetical protein H6H01_23195 [Nostoc calcicola FACHB-3891]|nr:hypothetical protein [Nostoc calcicola FACHB-3891]
MTNVEEECRIQNSEFSNLDARSSLPLRYQSGIGTRDFLVDHQIYDLVGVQKRRLFRRSCVANATLTATRTENIAVSG